MTTRHISYKETNHAIIQELKLQTKSNNSMLTWCRPDRPLSRANTRTCSQGEEAEGAGRKRNTIWRAMRAYCMRTVSLWGSVYVTRVLDVCASVWCV